MPHESLLLAFSQIGAVFAGFIAIFIALIHHDEAMDKVVALRARSILHTSVVTIFSSLLPLVLFAAGFSEAASWKLSAGAIVLIGLGLSIEGARHQLALSSEQKKATGLVFNVLSWGLTLVSFALAFSVFIGAAPSGIYPAGIAIVLVVSALNFVKVSLEQWL